MTDIIRELSIEEIAIVSGGGDKSGGSGSGDNSGDTIEEITVTAKRCYPTTTSFTYSYGTSVAATGSLAGKVSGSVSTPFSKVEASTEAKASKTDQKDKKTTVTSTVKGFDCNGDGLDDRLQASGALPKKAIN